MYHYIRIFAQMYTTPRKQIGRNNYKFSDLEISKAILRIMQNKGEGDAVATEGSKFPEIKGPAFVRVKKLTPKDTLNKNYNRYSASLSNSQKLTALMESNKSIGMSPVLQKQVDIKRDMSPIDSVELVRRANVAYAKRLHRTQGPKSTTEPIPMPAEVKFSSPLNQ